VKSCGSSYVLDLNDLISCIDVWCRTPRAFEYCHCGSRTVIVSRLLRKFSAGRDDCSGRPVINIINNAVFLDVFILSFIFISRKFIPSICECIAITQLEYVAQLLRYMPDNWPLAHELFTSCIDALHVWFCINGTNDKSAAILLGTHQWAHSYCSFTTIKVAGWHIPLVACIKILGVTLVKNLWSIDNHTNAVIESVCYYIHALQHIHSSMSEDTSAVTSTMPTLFYTLLLRKKSLTTESTEPLHMTSSFQSSSQLFSSSTGFSLNITLTSK